MLLSDIAEEILERVGNGPGRTWSMRSLIRKIDLKHKEVLRLRGYNNDDMAVLDILTGIAEYPLPCQPGNITSVYFLDQRLPLRQRNDPTLANYYYLVDSTIGIVLYGKDAPDVDVTQGLKIFHRHQPDTLTVADMAAEPYIEEPYRMLLVYGVLIDGAEPQQAQKYNVQYQDLLNDYIMATRDPESTTISEVFSL